MAEANQRKISLKFLPIPKIVRISWQDLFASLAPVVVVSVVVIAIAIHFVQPAPPSTITMTAGPKGSVLYSVAERYQKSLAKKGIKLVIMESAGSLDNLKRLIDPNVTVDVGFVQGGVADDLDIGELTSLGSVSYEPLTIVYRHPHAIHRLSELKGKPIAVGPEGSGTRVLALAILKANGIDPANAKLVSLSGDKAVDALIDKQVDAAFLMGDSAARGLIRKVLHTTDLRMFDFPQADAYLRRFRYLNKLDIPAGTFDLGANLPAKPTVMMAPTMELIARPDLHPALSDILIETAQEVHGKATLLQKHGEFPAPLEHEYPISEEANRYYKSGKGFAYRYMPFWLASLTDRILVMIVPVLVVLIPGLRFVPTLYGWRIRRRIYRHYGELMALERAALGELSDEEKSELSRRLDGIERAIISGKIPGAFADETYVLRQHIKFVRERLALATSAKATNHKQETQ